MNINIQNQFNVVRHGKAENNDLSIVSCKMETQNQYGLVQKGKNDISDESKLYTDFDIIYCSPFKRAEETASFFAKTSNCNIILDNRLREFDVGNLDLEPFERFVFAIQKHQDPNYHFPGGESLSDVLVRLIDFVKEINARNIHKKILIVTHGTPAEMLVDWWANIPLRKWEKCIKKGEVFPLKP